MVLPYADTEDDGDLIDSVIELIVEWSALTRGSIIDPGALEEWTVDTLFRRAEQIIATSTTT